MTNQGIVLERERDALTNQSFFSQEPKQAISIPNIKGKRDH